MKELTIGILPSDNPSLQIFVKSTPESDSKILRLGTDWSKLCFSSYHREPAWWNDIPDPIDAIFYSKNFG